MEGGGVLVTTPGFATHDRHGRPHPVYPGAGLDELLGARLLARLERPEREEVDLTNPVIAFPSGLKVLSYNRDVVTDLQPDVQVLARYEDGTPALRFSGELRFADLTALNACLTHSILSTIQLSPEEPT